MEQLVACWAHNPEVAGSNPASATKKQIMDYKSARPTASGHFRVYGMFGHYGTTKPARVWKATPTRGERILREDTILRIIDAHGYIDEVMAGEPGLCFG